MTLELDAERVSGRGGIAGDGVLNVLSKPALGFWDVFLRETLQNSNDARIGVDIPVRFTVEWTSAQDEALNAFREEVFHEIPPNHPLESSLRGSDLPILLISDQGTRGLGGPTDPTVELEAGGLSDFTSFVYNIGRDPDRAPGGGTYGFGKSILYLASSVGTVLIYSQTLNAADEIESRLIVASLGSRYSSEGKKYTGRHWWGVLDPASDDAARPLIGAPARALAEKLGVLRLQPEETGTTLAVLVPDLDSVSQEVPEGASAVRSLFGELRIAALKWCWPHLVDLGQGASIQFRFVIDKTSLPSLRIEEHSDLPYFVDAYREAVSVLAGAEPSSDYTLKSWQLPLQGKPFPTGVLVRRRSLIPGDGELRDRIAIMRSPRLVVEYRPVPADPNGLFAVGVFVATTKANEIFAAREPSTHDAWHNEDGRGGAEKRPVWRTNLDIRNAMLSDARNAPEAEGDESPPSGLEQLSEDLATQLSGLSAVGAGGKSVRPSRPGTGSRGGSVVRPRVEVGGLPAFVGADHGRITVDFPLDIRIPSGANGDKWFVEAEPRISLDDGGVEALSDLIDDSQPAVVGWGNGGTVSHTGDRIPIAAIEGDAPMVRILHPADVAVEIRLSTGETQ